MITFISGMIVGGFMGVILMCCLVMSKREGGDA